MMSRYLSASWIYPVSSPPMEQGVISVDKDGTILEIFSAEEAQQKKLVNVRYLEGVLVPGMVNTHVHLELSHLKGKISEATGLAGFVRQIMQERATEEGAEVVLEAMRLADQEMYVNGIVAAGDIANLAVSKVVKIKSAIYYHTFVETMGFNPVQADEIMKRSRVVQRSFESLAATITPHAPYSVSKPLFECICREGMDAITIHNQETAEENLFFEQKSGHFLELYQILGLDISFFKAQGCSSLQYFLPLMPADKRILLVHNTFTDAADIRFAQESGKDVFWCLCPNANLYIENRLPDLELFRQTGLKVTLGTDSLASNHQLSILEEMKTLQLRAGVSFEELLTWATVRGAEFLGMEQTLGSFERGKKPGINLITRMKSGMLSTDSAIQRIF